MVRNGEFTTSPDALSCAASHWQLLHRSSIHKLEGLVPRSSIVSVSDLWSIHPRRRSLPRILQRYWLLTEADEDLLFKSVLIERSMLNIIVMRRLRVFHELFELRLC